MMARMKMPAVVCGLVVLIGAAAIVVAQAVPGRAAGVPAAPAMRTADAQASSASLTLRMQLVQPESPGAAADAKPKALVAIETLVRPGQPFLVNTTVPAQTLLVRGTVQSLPDQRLKFNVTMERTVPEPLPGNPAAASTSKVETSLELRIGEEVSLAKTPTGEWKVHVAAAEPGPREAMGNPPMGPLGHTIGSYLTIEGYRRGKGKDPSSYVIDTVNGVRIEKPVTVGIMNLKLPRPDPAIRCVINGYETFRWDGQPDEVRHAEGWEAERFPFQPVYSFCATSVRQPADLHVDITGR